MQGKMRGIIRPDRLRVMTNFTRSFLVSFLRDKGRKGTVRVEAFCLYFCFINRVLILCIATFIWHEMPVNYAVNYTTVIWNRSLRAVMGRRTLKQQRRGRRNLRTSEVGNILMGWLFFYNIVATIFYIKTTFICTYIFINTRNNTRL